MSEKPDLYSFNIGALNSLRNDSVTAWIEPDGKLHVVPLFNHLSFFIQNSDFIEEVSTFLAQFTRGDGTLSISRQHMAQAMDMIYARGWGRVGTYGGDKIELDCDAAHMTDLRRKTKAIARMLNRGLVCRVVHPSQQPKKKHAALARDAVWSSLREGFVGWLSPAGDIYETAPDAPFSTFVDDPDRIPELAKSFEDAVREDKVRQADDFQQDFIEAYPDEGHMPWHNFWHRSYDPREEELAEMLALVLSHGWGRLRVENERTVSLEADEAFLSELEGLLEKVVAPTGCAVEARAYSGSLRGPGPSCP